MAGGFGRLPRDMIEALGGSVKKKNMTPEQRKLYWRQHFAERLEQRYGYVCTDNRIHDLCQKAITSGKATLIADGSVQVYRVGTKIREILVVYCNFDKEAQYVTSCLPRRDFR